MPKKVILPLLSVGLLAGCVSMAPDYERPDTLVAVPIPAEAEAESAAVQIADIGWREFFPDPYLRSLIETALDYNRDLRLAALNIEAARAQYNIQYADRLPSLNAEGSYTRSRTPGSVSQSGQTITTDRYQVGLGVAAFELDFFGRVRSLSDAALALYLASEEARRAAHISLIAEVGRAYLTERAFARQLYLARQALAARENAYELAQQRFRAGATSETDLRQQETLVETARISVAALRRQRAQAANALAVLVGRPIGELPAPASLAARQLVGDIPAGVPSDLLVRRPDILAAEQRLIAANANIGAARAAFFPRVTLTGSAGTASDELSGLFDSGTGFWSFMPQIQLPIFTGGRNRANLRLAEVRKEQAIVEYEQAIQTAFREVANALVARDALDDQVAAQERLRAAQAARLQLAQQRYDSGVASYIEVLDAQRELFDAELSLVQARQLRLTNTIDLYRALGGGLQEQTAPPSGQNTAEQSADRE